MNLAIILWTVPLLITWQAALCATAPVCPEVPEVGNATPKVLERHDASPYIRVQYSCNDGYYLEGPQEISCVDTGQGLQWHPEPPACHEVKECDEIWYIPNGYVTGDECCKPGHKLGFECKDDATHELVGASELTCLNNGSWDDPKPQCISRRCKPPEIPENGDVDFYKDGVFYFDDCCEHGVEAHFTCGKDHDLVGPQSITCRNREWSAPRPRCELRGTIPVCPEVPEVGNATPKVLERHDASPYITVQYTCNEGYYLEGPDEISCVDTEQGLQWHPEPPACHDLKDCDEINYIPNGYVTGDDCCEPGHTLGFVCDNDVTHQLVGARELTCLNNGSWDHPTPQCMSRSCKPPGIPRNGDVDYYKGPELYYDPCCEHGVEAHFTCVEEYDLIGPEAVTCWNSEWSAPRPRCKPKGVEVCEDLVVPNSMLREDKSQDYFVEGDTVMVYCNRGYRINGTDFLYCDEDGTWSDPVPSCIEYNCTRVDLGAHVIVEEFVNTTVFPVDSRIHLKCEEGYMLEGASSLTCSGGGWSRKSKCRRIHCGRPSVPEFGWMTINASYIGDLASFGCRTGYNLIGSKDRFCLENGVWGGSVARCVSEVGPMTERGCESPGIPDNGVKTGTYYAPGANVTFACNRGYHLRGEDTTICDHRGFWSHPLPTCIGRFYYDAPLDVKESLMKRVIKNISEALKAPVENPWALNLNVSRVRHLVYFLIDASTSVGERGFRKGVALATAIIKKINVTEEGHRVGVMTFGSNATRIVIPHVHTSMDVVFQRLGNISYMGGGTALMAALREVAMDFDLNRRFLSWREKLKFTIFLISDGKANLGGRPKQAMGRLLRGPYPAEVYGIGVASDSDQEALRGLVSKPTDDHLFIMRDYDSFLWLAHKLTEDTVDYSVCGRIERRNIEFGKEDDEKRKPRSVGDEKIEEAWPWMVQINRGSYACGASVIARAWILTAAHCVCYNRRNVTVSTDQVSIRLGLTDAGEISEAQNISIKRIIRHEAYNATTLENDIALLELENNMTYGPHVRPICLPPSYDQLKNTSDFYHPNANASIIGRGTDKWYLSEAGKLRQVKIIIHDDANCSRAYANHFRHGMMCAGGYGRGDACRVDGGGPLMQSVAKDEYIWTQVGIVSWGPASGCNRRSKPRVYTNVAKYRQWIDHYVQDAQQVS